MVAEKPKDEKAAAEWEKKEQRAANGDFEKTKSVAEALGCDPPCVAPIRFASSFRADLIGCGRTGRFPCSPSMNPRHPETFCADRFRLWQRIAFGKDASNER